MKPKNHPDFGLTKEEFLELIDFFRELIRLDEQPNYKPNLIRLLRARLHQLINKK